MKLNDFQLRLAIRKSLLSEQFAKAASADSYSGVRLGGDEEEKFGSVLTKSGDKYYIGDPKSGLSGDRLTKIMSQLEQFVNKEYPKLGLKIDTNGITRDLAAAADRGGNKARISGSKHGAGLGHDLKYHTEMYGPYTNYKTNNAELAKDEKFVKLLDKFSKLGSQSDLTWGGNWGRSNPAEGKVRGRGVTEFHHWEINDSELPKYFDKIKDALSTLGFSPADMVKSAKRAAFYKALLDNPENFLENKKES